MLIFLFFALFIAILAIIFAVQNIDPTTVSFFVWDFEGSLALIVLISLATGALISYLASLPSNIKNRLTIRTMRKKVTELETKLAEHTTPTDVDEESQASRVNKPDSTSSEQQRKI